MLKVEVLLTPTSSATSEELIEHIFMTEVPMTRGISSLLLPLDSLLTMLIIHSSLFGITECLISISNGLELFLGAVRVILVFVRVELDRHLFERLFDLVLGCASL